MNMRLLLVFLTALTINRLVGQDVDSTECFSPIYEFTFLDLDSTFIKYYANGGVAIIDSKRQNGNFLRFYYSGEISLIGKNIKVQMSLGDSIVHYKLSGYIETYYKGGGLRSCYYIDSLGNVVDNLHLFKEFGGSPIVTKIRQNHVYDGYKITASFDDFFLIEKFTKGLLIRSLYYKDGNFYELNDQSDLQKVKLTNRLKKIIKDYNLERQTIQITPVPIW